jgi:transcriptional regulator with XRE-family HTH domain
MDAARTIQRRALGDFLRARRDRLTPAAIGLPDGTRRRAPGLRREEVASLAGLSTTWYTWLEQGRDVSVSPQGLARIAVALRLDRAGRDYLFEIAGRRDPAPDPDPDALPATLPACLAAIATPAYVLDRPWNARAWNDAAHHLFAGWLDGPDAAPNLLRFVFLAPQARALLPDWRDRARRVLAEFRADCAAHLEDAPVARLLADLRRDSADFVALWQLHAVTGREGGARGFAHPTLGLLRYDQTAFSVAGRPDLKLVVLTPGTGC